MMTVSATLALLEPDPWRIISPFSEDVFAAQNQMFAQASKYDQAETLRRWLQSHQPCLFGRIAARYNQLGFCVLGEHELTLPDMQIRELIQEQRTRWTADAFNGQKSGFILLIVSPSIANSKPSTALASLSKRLCELYLDRTIDFDAIYHEDIFLEKPGPARETWLWRAGVNYFCANADGRWWQDHRIPGGMAFSVNSVGHMAKAGKIAHYMKELDSALETSSDQWPSDKVDDLGAALKLAMQTISLASTGPSGKATWLKQLDSKERSQLPACPIELPEALSSFNHCSYGGFYHTDVTLPSEYFRSDVQRPEDRPAIDLDFTYLFDRSPENPDHHMMGPGRRIREPGPRQSGIAQPVARRAKVTPWIAPVSDHPRLLAALQTKQ